MAFTPPQPPPPRELAAFVAELDSPGRVPEVKVWCDMCGRWHTHGMPASGERAAHCTDPLAQELGYVLVSAGVYPDDVPHGEGRYIAAGCRCDTCRAGRAAGLTKRRVRGPRPTLRVS